MAKPKSSAAIAKALMAAKVSAAKKAAKDAAKAETKARLEAERLARDAAKFEKKRPTCAECGGRESLPVGGTKIYPHRPGLAELRFWLCPCGAYVGCHKNTRDMPKGRPAGPATHKARIAAHAAFDPLWKAVSVRDGIDLGHARRRGYRWLGQQLGLAPEDTHIGWMDQAMAERVVGLVEEVNEARRR